MNVENIKPTRNNVLVKMKTQFSNEVDLGPVKIEIPIDPNNLSQMLQTEGVVVKCPPSLDKVPWETKIEIKEGDNVIFSFNALRDAIYHKGAHFTIDGEFYVLMRYHTLIAVVNGDDVKPLNGYCFIEPMKEEALPNSVLQMFDGIITPIPKQSARFGKMIMEGNRNLSYDNGKDVDYNDTIPEGTVIMFKKHSDVVVQYATHATLFGTKEVFRIQRRNIMAWLKEQ
jgi:co-chaperonin GroES (HSP10)